jgi:KDO2-lipid IV(A) lauroyltransferase
LKKSKYTFLQHCWRILLSFFAFLAAFLPVSLLRGLSLVAGAFVSSVPWGYPRRVKENIKLALGEENAECGMGNAECPPSKSALRTPHSALNNVARGAWQNIILLSLELLHYSRRPLEDLRQAVEIEGRENLEQALARGKGVVALSAHLGAFTLLAMKLDLEGIHGGYPTRVPKDPVITDFILKFNQRFGVRIISDYPRWKMVKDSWQCLEQNQVLYLLNDLHANDGIIVSFFGRPASVPAGALQMHKHIGSPIVPMYIVRQSGGKHKVVIEPPFQPEDTGNEERDLWVNTAHMTRIVEGWVRRYPRQWWWVHDRWKVRPKDVRKWQQKLEEQGLDNEPALRFW